MKFRIGLPFRVKQQGFFRFHLKGALLAALLTSDWFSRRVDLLPFSCGLNKKVPKRGEGRWKASMIGWSTRRRKWILQVAVRRSYSNSIESASKLPRKVWRKWETQLELDFSQVILDRTWKKSYWIPLVKETLHTWHEMAQKGPRSIRKEKSIFNQLRIQSTFNQSTTAPLPFVLKCTIQKR